MGDVIDLSSARFVRDYKNCIKQRDDILLAIYDIGRQLATYDEAVAPLAAGMSKEVWERSPLLKRFVYVDLTGLGSGTHSEHHLPEYGFNKLSFCSTVRRWLALNQYPGFEVNDVEPFATFTYSPEDTAYPEVGIFNTAAEFLVAHMQKIGNIPLSVLPVPCGAILQEYEATGWRLVEHNFATATRSNFRALLSKRGCGTVMFDFKYNILLEDDAVLNKAIGESEEDLVDD